MPQPSSGNHTAATQADIVGILGHIDSEQLLAILALQPTVAEVEEAAMWLSADPDVFGSGDPLKGKAAEIVTILTEDQDEES